MGYNITAPAKLTVSQVSGDINTIDASLQTFLRTLAADDDIISINMVKSNSGKIIAYITWEDQ